jgi:predicted nucleic acid-binding protein
MSGKFIDSNVLLYLTSSDSEKAARAEEIVLAGGIISVQVLSEVTNVCRRKMKLSWEETSEFLRQLQQLLPTIQPLQLSTHELRVAICERYQLSVYDGLIAAAALEAGCNILWSEDMHDGLLIDEKLRIVNPFGPQFTR